jgi:hypothetical protein
MRLGHALSADSKITDWLTNSSEAMISLNTHQVAADHQVIVSTL